MIHELRWAMARQGYLIDFVRRDEAGEFEYLEFYPVRGATGTSPDLLEIQRGMAQLGFATGLQMYVDQDTGAVNPSVYFEPRVADG